MSNFYVSATALNNFFECPAKFDFGRKFTPKEEPAHFRDGTMAHRLLSGEKVPDATARAIGFSNRLGTLYKAAGYKPLWVEDGKVVTEQRQQVKVAPGVILTRVIDAFAVVDGEPALVDYKTGTYPYISEGGATPQAMGFQAAAYLIPPKSHPFKEWPKRIDFLHAPERGTEVVYTYRYSEEDQKNLLDAVLLMKSAGAKEQFPKVRGYHCNNGKTKCPFFDVCYETPGWEKKYTERKK